MKLLIRKDVVGMISDLDESFHRAQRNCGTSYSFVKKWLDSCVEDHTIYDLDITSGILVDGKPLRQTSEFHEESSVKGVFEMAREDYNRQIESPITLSRSLMSTQAIITPTSSRVIPLQGQTPTNALRSGLDQNAVDTRPNLNATKDKLPTNKISRKNALMQLYRSRQIDVLIKDCQSRNINSRGTKSELVLRLVEDDITKEISSTSTSPHPSPLTLLQPQPHQSRVPSQIRVMPSQSSQNRVLPPSQPPKLLPVRSRIMTQSYQTSPPSHQSPSQMYDRIRAYEKATAAAAVNQSSTHLLTPPSDLLSLYPSPSVEHGVNQIAPQISSRIKQSPFTPITEVDTVRVPVTPTLAPNPLMATQIPLPKLPLSQSFIQQETIYVSEPSFVHTTTPVIQQAIQPTIQQYKPHSIQTPPSSQPYVLHTPTTQYPVIQAPPVVQAPPVHTVVAEVDEVEAWFDQPLVDRYLERQEGISPDMIFSAMVTCSLEEIFPDSRHVASTVRGSSGNWEDEEREKQLRKSNTLIEKDDE